MELSKREFLQGYILNSARGAGNMKLNVEAAIQEAQDAWDRIDKLSPPRRAPFKPNR